MLIRRMKALDLDFAAACTGAEGWLSEARPVFEGFLAHEPDGCLLAEVDGEPAGICVATGYGRAGFVGELIVVAQRRGQGVGRRLLEEAVHYLQARGAECIGLDGVLRAVPLYERVGFRKACRSLRFAGKVRGRAAADVRAMRAGDLEAVVALDRRAFGADRGFFLRRRWSLCPQLCRVLQQGSEIAGFCLGRPAGSIISVGPWVARAGVERPVALLEGLAPAGAELEVGLGVLETNTLAVEAMRALGFAERADSPWRMALGSGDGVGTSELALAIGSPAKG